MELQLAFIRKPGYQEAQLPQQTDVRVNLLKENMDIYP